MYDHKFSEVNCRVRWSWRMKSRGNEILRDAIELLRSQGATDIRHRVGGKHIKLTASYRGLLIVTTVPGTPSDWRAGRNTMACLKRQLRTADNDNSSPN